MRIAVLSDIHGLTTWKKIVDKEREQVDRFVFLGDYLDDKAGTASAEEQWENLLSIVELRKRYRQVDLLIGNHDLQYIGGARSNRFNNKLFNLVQDELTTMIREGIFQVNACHSDYLFSHAGISSIWMREKGITYIRDINRQFQVNPLLPDFVRKVNSNTAGDNVYQSPLWIRPDSLRQSAVPEFHQVVGHTRLREICKMEQEHKKLIFTDTQLRQYLVIDTEQKTEEIKLTPDY